MGNDPQNLMGPVEVGKYLGILEQTVYQWAQDGKLPAFKVGDTWRFKQSEIDRWLENNRSGPGADPVEPLTPYSEAPRSKWRIKKQQDESDTAIRNACKAYIVKTLDNVGRQIFPLDQFEDRYGSDLVRTVINELKKEKMVIEDEHEGLGGEKVKVIMKRE